MKKDNIPGLEGYYISRLGILWSRYHKSGKLTQNEWHKVKPNHNQRGYLFVQKKGKCWYLHRLVALHFIPNPENKLTVNHKNGIKNDNRIDNLEWATDSEQQLHAVVMGLRNKTLGENSNLSKLKNNDVLKIRELYATGNYFQREIADMFGIAEESCHRIIKRKDCKHI